MHTPQKLLASPESFAPPPPPPKKSASPKKTVQLADFNCMNESSENFLLLDSMQFVRQVC